MLQEAADVAALNAEGSLGPNERQRRLRWPERLRITQSSLATQARGPPRMAIASSLAHLHLSVPTGLQGAGRVTQGNCFPKQRNVSGKLLVFLFRQSLVVISNIIGLDFYYYLPGYRLQRLCVTCSRCCLYAYVLHPYQC